MEGDLHEGELAADATTVTELLRAQAPQLAALPVRPLGAVGTVNRVFRLGEELAVRLPRLPEGGADVAREAVVVPQVAQVLRVAVPEPVLIRAADAELFDAAWSVVRWVEGEPARAGEIRAGDLADVVEALGSLDPTSLPAAGRATAAAADETVRASIGRLEGFDRSRVLAAWDAALTAPTWDGILVAVHADLLPPNLVVRAGRLSGVLDRGSAGAGDPANDLVPAWSCLRGDARTGFRARLAPDAGTWAWACGIALAQAVVAIPYSADTNPSLTALCRATLTEVLTEPGW